MNTVYVIGAGASKEAGLPTGEELKTKISSLLDIKYDEFGRKLLKGDREIAELCKDPNGNRTEYHEKAHHISDALLLALSIDNFIDTHRGDKIIEFLSKLSIARSILLAENASKLKINSSRLSWEPFIDFNALNNTWYLSFFKTLTENCSVSDLKKRFSKITLVIFNYDRCIEHFLFHALLLYYKIAEDKAAEIVSCLTIFHPYGQVGLLPWQTGENPVEFGQEVTGERLLRVSKNLKTFTEGIHENQTDINELRLQIKEAKRLAFLGFSFHPLNMKLLTSDYNFLEDWGVNTRCFATVCDISKSDQDAIREDIAKLYPNAEIDIHLTDKYCKDFFGEFHRSLSLSVT